MIVLGLLATTSAFAQSRRPVRNWPYQKKAVARKDSNATKSSQRKAISETRLESRQKVYGWDSATLQASIGFGIGGMQSDAAYTGGTSGLRIDIGSHFDLDENWTASTFIRGNYDKVNEDSVNAPFGMEDLDVKAYDLGIAQRFTFQTHSDFYEIAPFVEAHVGRGYFVINESEQLSTGTISARTEFLYTKATAAAGLQFKVNNLLPYLRYEYGLMVFDDVVGYEVYEINSSRTGSSIIENENNLDYTFSSYSVGVSYLF